MEDEEDFWFVVVLELVRIKEEKRRRRVGLEEMLMLIEVYFGRSVKGVVVSCCRTSLNLIEITKFSWFLSSWEQ